MIDEWLSESCNDVKFAKWASVIPIVVAENHLNVTTVNWCSTKAPT